MLHAYKGGAPKLPPTAFVEASPQVIGDVELAEEVGVWFTSVIRGDVNLIRIGRGSNIQDGTVIHVNRRGPPTLIEEYVTVGHAARLPARAARAGGRGGGGGGGRGRARGRCGGWGAVPRPPFFGAHRAVCAGDR